MLGTAAMILTGACTSTEKRGTVHDAKDDGAVSTDRSARHSTLQGADAHPPVKQSSPSPAPRTGGKGQPESPSSSAGNRAGDAEAPSDQREAGITPLDQSEAPQDLEVTRRIRQAVIQDVSLSFRAKNVTNGNRVVLTGPVNTRAEADRIKDIAQSITPYRIEDRLEIRQ